VFSYGPLALTSSKTLANRSLGAVLQTALKGGKPARAAAEELS
jgi:hypothetical protein